MYLLYIVPVPDGFVMPGWVRTHCAALPPWIV